MGFLRVLWFPPTVERCAGGTCQSGALPALMRPPVHAMQPSLDVKPFLPFPLDTASAVSLFPNFNARVVRLWNDMPAEVVDEVLISTLKRNFDSYMDGRDSSSETATISKGITLVAASDSVTAESVSGAEKSLTSSGCNTAVPKETEEEKAKRLLYCSLCKVAVNSASQLEAHNSGSKHKTMLEARNGGGPIKAFPRPGVKGKTSTNKGVTTGLQNKTFHCEICDVHVNSETQLKQHISSRRHKDRAAGKPPKPKYSPYNKLQRGSNALALKLAFQKELSKPLAARLLPNPFAAAAAAAAAVNSPFALRSGPAAALFQTAALPPALLRPAPGPIRAAHTPVLFAPY
ncbi:zinc finger protein 385D-like isoform X7 [Hemitrygon akajei]|uniref:zinc finger protein 385D-like isoform X7 n=1 Tax=Hemitrygon akajei TaxID=2704970 RepID=UPI003BF9FA5C